LLLYESQATAHAFDLFDQDKDGFLKGNELKYFIASIHTEIGIDEVTEDNISEVKSTFDANNDGEISKAEVIAFFGKLHADRRNVVIGKAVEFASDQGWRPGCKPSDALSQLQKLLKPVWEKLARRSGKNLARAALEFGGRRDRAGGPGSARPGQSQGRGFRRSVRGFG
jgi:Ca2+-binding EF-hand superfamily protein